MLTIAVATSSGTRTCDFCGRKIWPDQTIMLDFDTLVEHINHSLVFHRACFDDMLNTIDKFYKRSVDT